MPLGMYYKKALLNSIFKQADAGAGAPLQSPSNVYLSLHTADPTAVHTAALANELESVGSPGYARVTIPTDADIITVGDWENVTEDDDSGNSVLDGTGTKAGIRNFLTIDFAAATGDWDTFSHFGLWIVASAGGATDYLGYGPISSAITILDGDTFCIQGAILAAHGKFRIGVA